MAKKLTDTNKWDKEWFQNLSLKHKCLWLYICDKCNNAGVWDVNFKLASFLIGETITEEDLKPFGDRVVKMSDSKILLPDYVYFQCGVLSHESKPHNAVIKLLKESDLHFDADTLKVFHSLPDSLPDRLSDTLPGRLPGSLHNKEKEKEKEKDNNIIAENSKNENFTTEIDKQAMDVLSYAKRLPTVSKLKNQITISQARDLIHEFGFKSVLNVLDDMQAWDEKKLLKKSDVAAIVRAWSRKSTRINPSQTLTYSPDVFYHNPNPTSQTDMSGFTGITANP